ncbi:MAG: hypothetical protein IH944_00710 [Armatimonadetes bacterium]|nr:hypothetical protein [Armatimonadota bacterium]
MTADDMQEPKPDEAAGVVKEEAQLPDPPSEEDLAKAERLLQESSLAQIRNQNLAAERLLKEAAEIAPGSAAVQAAIGDEFQARGQYSKARKAYYLAHQLKPDEVAYETKYAESILGGSSMSSLAISNSLAEQYASAKSAVILSVFFCGLGQIVSGRRAQGGVLMAIWLLGLGWLFGTSDGISGLVGLAGISATPGNSLMLIPAAMIIVSWLTSIVSASGQAKGSSKRSIDRPIPPGEGDFEL